MRKCLRSQFVFVVPAFLILLFPALSRGAERLEDSEPLVFQRAAVASFLVGQRRPHMDETMDQTLSCPIGEICRDDPGILPHAGTTLTRLVEERMHALFDRPIATRAAVRDAEARMALNPDQDTPVALARKLGRLLDVDMVVIGTVWRYRERGAIEGAPDRGASVAFAVYFIEAGTGRQLWRGVYDGAQQTVLENLFQARKQLRIGLRWLSADELAAHGVREVFRQLPDNIQPDIMRDQGHSTQSRHHIAHFSAD